MIARENENVSRPGPLQNVDVLKDRVSGSLIPPVHIHLPKIKETAAVPGIKGTQVQGIPSVRLPTTQTVMQPVALQSPTNIPQQEAGLAVAYTPQQQVVENITQIDPERLNAGRAKKDDDSYNVVQLRAIAGSLNLSKSGNKKDLVERIKAKMLSINPNAFN